jgi:hypothetical protein
MRTDFIPASDAGLLAFGANFSTIVTADPVVLGLSAPIATTLAAKQVAYASAYTAAVDPGTRGGATVLAKDLCRRDLVAYIRLLARTIQGTLTVTDEQRYALGLTVRHMPVPIPAPATAPDIDIVSVSGRTVKIRLHEAGTSTKRGKPAGVQGAAIFSHVGATAPATLADWTFEGNSNKTVVLVQFPDEVPSGATVWFTAYWFNPRSQPGPNSTPVSSNLPGGSVNQAA